MRIKKVSVAIILLIIIALVGWLFLMKRSPITQLTSEVGMATATTTTTTPKNISEEIGRTLMIGVKGTSLTDTDKTLMQMVRPGGVILFAYNIRNQSQTQMLAKSIQETAASYSPYPIFIAIDQEGGAVSRIPGMADDTGEPAITNTSTAYLVAQSRAKQLHEVGINVNLAPVLDLATTTDYLYNRTFQEPYPIAGALGAAMIAGTQSAKVLSTLKHFPGYVGVSNDPELTLTSLPVPQIGQFKIAATADPAFVMVSSARYPTLDPNLAFPVSPTDITYLRSNIPGNYLVMTDDLSGPTMRSVYGIASDTVMAMDAGVDVEMVVGWQPNDVMTAYNALVVGVNNGTISTQKIDDEFNKIIAMQKNLE